MDLSVLKNFIVVARELNITRASKLVHITQSALSRQMFQLEETLGTKLFERSKYCIKLTDKGLFFYHRAQELIELYEKTKKEISIEDTEIAGELTIGAGEFRSIGTLCEIVSEFQTIHPKVIVHMRTAFTPDILERLNNGLIDFGVIFDRPHTDSYSSLYFREKEEWGVLVPKDSPLAKLKKIYPTDLAEIPLLISGNFENLETLRRWFGPLVKCLTIRGTYNLLNNAAFLSANNAGAALCIKLNCSYKGLVFTPLTPSVSAETKLLWREDLSQTKVKEAFIEFLQKFQNRIFK